MRMTKKLFVAIASLLVSVVLCIGVCLAWFISNEHVDAGGPAASVDRGDILRFEVTAYYLDAVTGGYTKAIDGDVETINGSYEVDGAPKGVLNAPISGEGDKDEMRPYNLITTYTTAILIEINYELKATGKAYRIFASCPTAEENQRKVTVSQNQSESDVFDSALSNAVYFSSAEESSGVYNALTDKSSLVNSSVTEYVKRSEITLVRDIIATPPVGESTLSGTKLIMVDYDSAFLNYLYRMIAAEGGSRNSRLSFSGDITIGIREYDPEDEVVPQSITFLSGTTSQPQGDNVLAAGWRFRVTYSDSTTKEITGNDFSLYLGMNTRIVGTDKTARVIYTENGKSVETTVTYSITARDHEHVYSAYSITEYPTMSATGTATSTCSVCEGTRTKTLPNLEDDRYTITGDTATAGVGGTGTYSITIDGINFSFIAVTKPGAIVAVTGVSLNKTSTSLTVGGNETLTATVTPSDATDKSVTWSTSNASVATVSSSGKITAQGAGTATITATTTDGGFTASCTVTVEEAAVPVTSVTLNKTSISMTAGATWTLTATVLPDDATDAEVSWTSSKTSVATVNSSGKITAVGPGTATITASAGGKSATCTVTVTSVSTSAITENYTYTYARDDRADGDIESSTEKLAISGGKVNNSWLKLESGSSITFSTVKGATVTMTTYSNTAVNINGTNVTPTGGSSPYTLTYVVPATGEVTVSGGNNIFIRSLAVTMPVTYTVTFNANGHGTAPAAQTVISGDTATEPTAPTASGFTFGGWYTTDACTTEFDFTTPITANTTVYAKWTVASGDVEYVYAFDDDSTFTNTGFTPGNNQIVLESGIAGNPNRYILATFSVTAGKKVIIEVTGSGNASKDAGLRCLIDAGNTATVDATDLSCIFPSGNGDASVTFDVTGAGTFAVKIGRAGGTKTTFTALKITVTDGDNHTHAFATGWTSSDANHWHAATCGHTAMLSNFAAHSGTPCTVCGYGESPTPTVTSVTVSGASSVAVGGNITLTAAVTGTNSPAQTVTWSSSDDTVATVSSAGVVTGVAAGTVTITATSTVDGTKSGTKEITVTGGGGGGNTPTTPTGNNMIETTSSLLAGGTLIDNDDLSIVLNSKRANSVSKTFTTTQVEGGEVSFTKGVVQETGGTIVITSKKAQTIVLYVTATNGSLDIKTGTLTIAKSGVTPNQTVEIQQTDEQPIHKIVVTLEENQTCTLSLSSNRIGLMGVYAAT